MCTLRVSNVIYHKFSHGAAFYTLSGKNVNVMLELIICQLSAIEYNWNDWYEFFVFLEGSWDRGEWTDTVKTAPFVLKAAEGIG